MKKQILILFFSLCAVIVFLFVLFNFILYPKKYDDYVIKYSAEYNLDSSLVYSIIHAESNFDKKAISTSGALGLMQILPRTAVWIAAELEIDGFTESQLFDPELNVRFGCFYLSYLFNKFSDMKAVICAYNAGEGVVKNWLNEDGSLNEEKISISETKEYLRRVLNGIQVYSNSQIYI